MKRTLLSLMLLVGLMLPSTVGAAAQPDISDQTYTSEITGDEIDLGSSGDIRFIPGNFDFNETVSFQEEYIWFTYGWSNFQLVLIGGPNDVESYHSITLGNMEVFYDSWELIDEEITPDHSWFLGAAEIQGAPLIVYYEFELDAYDDIDQAVMQFTDLSTFAHDLEFAQSEVTIGGQPLLPNTDAQMLGSLAGHDSGTPDSSPEIDEDTTTERTSRTSRSTDTTDEGEDVDETEDGTTTERTSRTSRSGSGTTGDDDDVDSGNTSETTGRTGDSDDSGDSDRASRAGRLGDLDNRGTDEEDDVSTPVSGDDWGAMGLVSDSEWESPSRGNVITWDATVWEFPRDLDQAIVVNEEYNYDVLTLQTTDGLGYVYVTVDDQYESTPLSLVEYWQTDEYRAQIANEVTVLDYATTANTASLVYETTNLRDQPLLVILEATFLEDGTIIFSQISAAPETIDQVYEQYSTAVEVDGAPLEMTWDVDDITDIVGN